MGTINRPSKQSVRAWMQQRQRQRDPLPDIAQIKRQLAWASAWLEVVQTDDERASSESDNEFSDIGNRMLVA